MACLPETERDRNELQETDGGLQAGENLDDVLRAGEDLNEECFSGETNPVQEKPHGSPFGSGFLAGFLTALLGIGVFLAGWSAAQHISRVRDRDAAADLGAGVLTDYRTLSKLDEVQNLIEQHFLNDVDSGELSSYLFKGAAAGLEDPYASYYSEEELESVLDSSRGEYRGIGTTLREDIETHQISVDEVYAGTPAETAGLCPGDILLAVDDTEVSDQGLTEIVSLIKSKEDTFTLRVFRPETQEELELELECGDVELSYVEYELKEGRIGYIRLTEFTEKAVEQFEEALQALDGQGMEKLIVDLRDNPGGRLDSVCEILDDLLPEGLIVYTEDRNGERSEKRSDKDQMVTCEIAVLVNGGSASASEIFAGAVQDYGLGPVIGTQTYGKGVVQDTYILSDGSAFKMTTEKYFTPKGQDIDGNGITPDIAAEEPDGGAEDGEEPETADGDMDAAEPETAEEPGTADADRNAAGESADPVLEKALEVLR